MKRIIILIVMFLLSLTAVSAAGFDFKIVSIRNEIESGETGQFLLLITSNYSSVQDLVLYSPDIEWDVPTDTIKVYPNGDTSHKLVLTPSKYVTPGKIYGVKINLKNPINDELVYEGIAEVNVKSSTKAVSAYKPSIRMTIEMASEINLSKPINAKVNLENQNLIDYSNLLLKISSEASGFDTENSVELIPLGNKLIEFNFDINPIEVSPGEYDVNFELWQGGVSVGKSIKQIRILSISAFKEEETTKSFLFKKKIRNNVRSESNVESIKTLTMPIGFFKNIFTSVNLDAKTEKENGERMLVIDIPLQPGETKEVVITTNYRIILYLIILIAILIGVHLKYKSPLKLSKTISDVNLKEGGISDLKITIEMQSTAKKTIKKATITDYIPDIASIQKEFGEGTLKPSRVFRHGSKGMVLKWEIEDIAPGEDRLITYSMKSKLSIIGQFKVPRAKISFKKKGKDVVSYSNSAGVSTE